MYCPYSINGKPLSLSALYFQFARALIHLFYVCMREKYLEFIFTCPEQYFFREPCLIIDGGMDLRLEPKKYHVLVSFLQ
jgi:hypothetical protein